MATVTRIVTPLPATRDEMLSRRKPSDRTLNDEVDEIHVNLFREHEEYTRLLDAVYDEDAVEGDLLIDTAKAAEIIREFATEHHRPTVARKKLATIVKALNVVLRRYGISRKQRAGLIGGAQVSTYEK